MYVRWQGWYLHLSSLFSTTPEEVGMPSKYVAILRNKRSGTLTASLLEAHVAHLRKLTLEGSLFLCGPFKDNDGAMQIIHAASYEAAKAMLERDPFLLNGYYQRYELFELIEANAENNWLMSDAQTQSNMGSA
jgi:uncharacterized protein YciI